MAGSGKRIAVMARLLLSRLILSIHPRPHRHAAAAAFELQCLSRSIERLSELRVVWDLGRQPDFPSSQIIHRKQ
jgi:hypothetical protein